MMRTRLALALLGLAVLALVQPTRPAATAADREAPSTGPTIEVSKKQIDFKVGKNLVTTYHIDPEAPKPFFWPVNAPSGVPVTRSWPMAALEPNEKKDHEHQTSAWFCHGDVIPEGLELKQRIKGVDGVDFWSVRSGCGRMVCVEVGKPSSEKNHARVVTRNEWRTPEGVKILDETRTIHLHLVGKNRLLVLDVELKASAYPITFGDTKEGSMAVRVRGPMTEEKKGGILTNADGKQTMKDVWGQRSKWCDYSGTVPRTTSGDSGDDKVAVGITIFDDPDNPHPASWHSRNYGLMAANPFGRKRSGFPAVRGDTDLVKLPRGGTLKLRYGVLLHDGDVKEGKVAESFQAFLKLKG